AQGGGRAGGAAAVLRPGGGLPARPGGGRETGRSSPPRRFGPRHFAAAGTRTSPIESCSTRYSSLIPPSLLDAHSPIPHPATHESPARGLVCHPDKPRGWLKLITSWHCSTAVLPCSLG